jgi:deazaflavin-dependent oxidoreductase (nitroreductase family)
MTAPREIDTARAGGGASRAARRGEAERPRNPFVGSARGGRVLSTLMLPDFTLMPPAGFGVLTTTGRRTGKTRRRCIRAIRVGGRAYIVMLGPALTGRPGAVSAWLWNIRADPRVRLRIRGGTFAGTARELTDESERREAREAYCDTVNAFDYLECAFHRSGRPSRAKIKGMHRHWFDTGVPLVVDLADG